MNESGAVKFQFERDKRELTPFPGFEELNAARQSLRHLGLIGLDENGIGFGNVSLRDQESDSFCITGTATGGRPELQLRDYARVTEWDFSRNWLRCQGAVTASAESLTHAAVYTADAKVRVVIHGHDHRLWKELLRQGAATSSAAEYGTPAMAREVQRLFRETEIRDKKIFAMGGHANGIVAFGSNFQEVLQILTPELERTRAQEMGSRPD
jgi:hypothetical protein